jgi:hypothetical protein
MLLQSSQDSATGLYPESVESNPHHGSGGGGEQGRYLTLPHLCFGKISELKKRTNISNINNKLNHVRNENILPP